MFPPALLPVEGTSFLIRLRLRFELASSEDEATGVRGRSTGSSILPRTVGPESVWRATRMVSISAGASGAGATGVSATGAGASTTGVGSALATSLGASFEAEVSFFLSGRVR